VVTTELTTDRKGAIAESAIAAAAIRLGIDVYRPLSDGGRYDVIFDVGSRLLRVQWKWASRRGNVIVIPFITSRRAREGFRRRSYDATEIDAIAAYCLEVDRVFFFELRDVKRKTYLQLRLSPCRNNQRRLVNWADDFAFDARLKALAGP
jgi:hypothetical protein